MGSPRWMNRVLLAAAAYNLLWGTWVILRPLDIFVWTNATPPNYPAIWQCVGMIVGVYGIGYAIAASDPVRHWPIVLVGLLGKVFGPIGFVWMLLTTSEGDVGRLPISWGWINVTNDLIWWVPFAAILYHAAKTSLAPTDKRSLSLAEANATYRDQNDKSINELSKSQSVLIVFLRHSGCTFCREALADISHQRASIESNHVKLVVVHMGDDDAGAEMMAAYGLDDVSRISDPSCSLYQAYDLQRGKLTQLLGPSVWWRGFLAAIFHRHGVGPAGGDGFQMPGTFLVRDGLIIQSFRHKTAADRPSYSQFCHVAK